MYKVVNVADLNSSKSFDKTDKVIEISNDQTKMFIADNDYEHKNVTYISNCIDIVDNSLNSYESAINSISSTYFTTELTNVYLPNGCAITTSAFETILSSDAFMTKDDCKKIETDCISYINELKNRAVSSIMAQLNESFIKQQSVKKLVYGQTTNNNYDISAFSKVTNVDPPKDGDYNFEIGEFSLSYLLFSFSAYRGAKYFKQFDAWTYPNRYLTVTKTYLTDESYDSIDALLKLPEISSSTLFNADLAKEDCRVRVPSASYDYVRNRSIPIGLLVEYFLKKQIKTSIKRICDEYISKMTSVPTFYPIV